jgi:hypothetical protein
VLTRLRAFARTRRGRQLTHDLAIAGLAALAVIKGAHTVDLGVLEAAGIAGVKTLLRLVLPVPAN